MPNRAKTVLDALEPTGIPFEEDAWFDENADQGRGDYGVVIISDSRALWGDDGIVAQNLRGRVVLYVADGSDDTAQTVQTALKGIPGIALGTPTKEFLQEFLCNRWTWQFMLDEGL